MIGPRRQASRLSVAALATLLLAFLTGVSPDCVDEYVEEPPPGSDPVRIRFDGVGANGIFDPSVTRDPATGDLWMSYSAVNPSAFWSSQNPDVVETRLARSTSNGVVWSDFGLSVNPPRDVLLPRPAPRHTGTWHNEVSSLVHDPGALPGQQWKLVWHHYLVSNGEREFTNGWIGYRTSSTPGGLTIAPEIKLLTGGFYDPANDAEGGTTRSPLGGPPVIRLADIDPALVSCTAASEPDLQATPQALYLSLLCGRGEPALDRIVLLRCAAPCAAARESSWSYVGTLLDGVTAVRLGVQGFSAPDVVEAGGDHYLIATPVFDVPFSYKGCLIFRFADLDAGLLESALGVPIPVEQVDGVVQAFHGACAYQDESFGGVLVSDLAVGEPERFRIFKTFVPLGTGSP